jgi:hypothetical protein
MLLLTMLFAGLAWGQCVKQPAVALKGVDEFACRGMSYEQAWDTLTAGGVAPVRPIRVAEMSMKTNYNSRKQLVSRGLRIVGFATGIVAAYFGQDLKGWQIGALAAGPSVVDQGIKWVAGEPDAFTQLPDDSGFTTIYALATKEQIVGAKSAVTSAPPVDHNILRRRRSALPETPQDVVTSPAARRHRVPPDLAGLLDTDDLGNPRSASDVRWIAEYYRSRNNEAEAEAVLARGYPIDVLVAAK